LSYLELSRVNPAKKKSIHAREAQTSSNTEKTENLFRERQASAEVAPA